MKSVFPLLTLVVVLLASGLRAQKFELGLFGGLSAYSGDIAPSEFGIFLDNINLAAGASLRYSPIQPLTFRFSGLTTQVEAQDPEPVPGEKANRFVNFRSKLDEFALIIELDLFYLGGRRGFSIAPFIAAGAGVAWYNPESFIDGRWVELQPLGTEGQGIPGPNYAPDPYALNSLMLPIGGGLKFNLGEAVTLSFEIVGRRMFTDYLDDVGHTRVSYLDVLEGNGSLAARLSNPLIEDPSTAPELVYRRGGKFVDWYYVGGANLSFRIGGRGFGQAARTAPGCPFW